MRSGYLSAAIYPGFLTHKAQWIIIGLDNSTGCIVAMAKYSVVKGPVEDYVDLAPVPDNLMIDKKSFLSDTDEAEILYTAE